MRVVGWLVGWLVQRQCGDPSQEGSNGTRRGRGRYAVWFLCESVRWTLLRRPCSALVRSHRCAAVGRRLCGEGRDHRPVCVGKLGYHRQDRRTERRPGQEAREQAFDCAMQRASQPGAHRIHGSQRRNCALPRYAPPHAQPRPVFRRAFVSGKRRGVRIMPSPPRAFVTCKLESNLKPRARRLRE